MFSYAGFATVYVKDKDYDKVGLFPTKSCLEELLTEFSTSLAGVVGGGDFDQVVAEVMKARVNQDHPDAELSDPESLQILKKSAELIKKVRIEDFYPGDYVDLSSGQIIKAFVNGYSDSSVRSATNRFYDIYHKKSVCLSFKHRENYSLDLEQFEKFLSLFNDFVVERVSGPDAHFDQLLGKSLKFVVTLKKGNLYNRTVRFGEGIINDVTNPNKICYVQEEILASVINAEALLEDLYTGNNAIWERHPIDKYNHDIVSMIVRFSYVYRNNRQQIINKNIDS